MKRLLIVMSLLLLIAVPPVYGQSESEMETLKLRAKEKVKQLNDYISFMGSSTKKDENRDFYYQSAKKLFVANCDEYREIHEYKDGTKKEIVREGVTMEVASLRTKTTSSRLMKEYFRGLMNLWTNYKTVTIETTDISDMRVSKLQPYGTDAEGRTLYICSVYFDQLFVGRRGDGGTYKDLTHKWVVCYVAVDEVYDPATGRTYPEYMVSLGDAYVESIERVF